MSVVLLLGPFHFSVGATETTQSHAPELKLTHNRMTAKLVDVPLRTVLASLAHQSKATIVLRGTVEESISASFTDLPVDEGLTRLLRGKSFTLIYAFPSATNKESSLCTLKEIHLLPSGDTATLDETIIFPPDAGVTDDRDWDADPVDTLSQKILLAKSKHEREQGVLALGETWQIEAMSPLSQAIVEDESPKVRKAAALALGNSWSAEAVEPLGQALLEDDDAAVRAMAARALGDTWNDDAIAPLIDAVRNDPDEQVRQAAVQALRELGYAESVAAE